MATTNLYQISYATDVSGFCVQESSARYAQHRIYQYNTEAKKKQDSGNPKILEARQVPIPQVAQQFTHSSTRIATTSQHTVYSSGSTIKHIYIVLLVRTGKTWTDDIVNTHFVNPLYTSLYSHYSSTSGSSNVLESIRIASTNLATMTKTTSGTKAANPLFYDSLVGFVMSMKLPSVSGAAVDTDITTTPFYVSDPKYIKQFTLAYVNPGTSGGVHDIPTERPETRKVPSVNMNGSGLLMIYSRFWPTKDSYEVIKNKLTTKAAYMPLICKELGVSNPMAFIISLDLAAFANTISLKY